MLIRGNNNSMSSVVTGAGAPAAAGGGVVVINKGGGGWKPSGGATVTFTSGGVTPDDPVAFNLFHSGAVSVDTMLAANALADPFEGVELAGNMILTVFAAEGVTCSYNIDEGDEVDVFADEMGMFEIPLPGDGVHHVYVSFSSIS